MPQTLQPTTASHLIAPFLHPCQIAEPSLGISACLLRRHATADVLLGAHLDVEPRFLINFTVNRLSAHKAAYSTKQAPQQSHDLERPLRSLHHLANGQHESLPILILHLELFAPGASESIETGAAIILRCPPLRPDPAAFFQPVERRIE